MTLAPITYTWKWQLQSSAADLWPYVADTPRFNLATGLPAIHYEEIPLETGGSRRMGETSRFGISARYEDYPFEWVQGESFRNVRIFESGPLDRTDALVTLTPNNQGTLLTYVASATPNNIVGALGTYYLFGWEMRRHFERAFRQMDDFLQQRVEKPFDLPVRRLKSAGQTRLARLSQELRQDGYDLLLVNRLVQLLQNEPDMELVRIRPYVVADQWQVSRRETLELFLAAAKIGLLNLRWDLMCPLCQGAKATSFGLDQVRKGVHCSTCNIDFEAEFTQNVELTFTPNPQVREVEDNSYCMGGPMVTPHILMHQYLEPGETRTVAAKLSPGAFRVRTQKRTMMSDIELYPVGKWHIRAAAEGISVKLADTTPDKGQLFALHNNTDHRQRFFLEEAGWYTNAVTAAKVTSMQKFRDLFSDQVLRPGEDIGVQGMTILFTDLVGSTAMYNRQGDALSYSVVREQFAFLQDIVNNYEGAIVKTIGDAIMATFTDPVQGVGAALAIQQAVMNFNGTHPGEPITLKLGVHHGPCIAVNLSGRLDYFGATVNMAARLEGQSRGGDVIISDSLRRDPAVEELLAQMSVQEEPFTATLKGFDDGLKVYRLQVLDNE